MQKKHKKALGNDFSKALLVLRGWDLNRMVLHFRCDENATVSSAALTVHRTVIQYRLTFRVMSFTTHGIKHLTHRFQPKYWHKMQKIL